MFKGYRIGSIVGIPLKIDITFLLVLPLFAWLIGIQLQPLVDLTNLLFGTSIDAERLDGPWAPWVIGLTAALGLFFGVLLHELGHSIAAMYFGYEIDSITLWIFGGLAQLVDQPSEWRHELIIAISGPIVSVLVGVITYLAMLPTPVDSDAMLFILGYLALMNIALAAFNMLPAFPMDGGRVLRALLSRNRPFTQATKLAAEIGKMFALLMGLFGLFQLNIIMIGIAFFIFIAASGESRQTELRVALEGVSVGDIMSDLDRTISPSLSLQDLYEVMIDEQQSGFVVASDGYLAGVVSIDELQQVDRLKWNRTQVGEVMVTDIETTDPDQDAMDALMQLYQSKTSRMLVTDSSNRVLGTVSETEINAAIQGELHSDRSEDPSTEDEIASVSDSGKDPRE